MPFRRPDNLTIFFRDVTERRRLREELVRLAQRDPLTGLANRSVFAERLAAGLQAGAAIATSFSSLMDLDGFKAVNDSMGHGRRCLLKEFASRLTDWFAKATRWRALAATSSRSSSHGPIEARGRRRKLRAGSMRPCSRPSRSKDAEVDAGQPASASPGARARHRARRTDQSRSNSRPTLTRLTPP
jgi:hypothetical protein